MVKINYELMTGVTVEKIIDAFALTCYECIEKGQLLRKFKTTKLAK